ncbi:hypothetical protein CY34DRAFT_18321 [Suillus luteus UH-Slu-Lm8-n1]|uniref:ABC transmembrane type-1 domain-containing protein n=1 Tax=Suillus luteus UH-Slu-Lm8-n1 TaxID=930992 RepID=A0A0D0A5S1_9AGAM|nr:hypothetical protein CY34DRAFT_18321 [Suillus luteus UH-Slu-Lm8-n1]
MSLQIIAGFETSCISGVVEEAETRIREAQQQFPSFSHTLVLMLDDCVSAGQPRAPRPFEIIIVTTFLYNLLGISSFTGFIVLLAGWPLNNFVTTRSIHLQKSVSALRDQHMAVLNELIRAVKFIKFLAWEDRRIQRAMDAPGVEMNLMVKGRINSVLIWTSAPILVSLISFLTFLYQGHQPTASVAFTDSLTINIHRAVQHDSSAIRHHPSVDCSNLTSLILSFIIRELYPMAGFPTSVVLKRIETYLEEDEFDEQVSSSGP